MCLCRSDKCEVDTVAMWRWEQHGTKAALFRTISLSANGRLCILWSSPFVMLEEPVLARCPRPAVYRSGAARRIPSPPILIEMSALFTLPRAASTSASTARAPRRPRRPPLDTTPTARAPVLDPPLREDTPRGKIGGSAIAGTSCACWCRQNFRALEIPGYWKSLGCWRAFAWLVWRGYCGVPSP
jgi:hypothetical protein